MPLANPLPGAAAIGRQIPAFGQNLNTAEEHRSKTRGLIAVIMMLAVWVSFHPFKSEQGPTTGGDIVNQLGFGFLLILCLIAFAFLTDRRLIARLISPSYVALGLVLVVSIAVSSNIASSFRAMIFSVIVVLAAVIVLVMPRNMKQFSVMLGLGCLLTLAASYFGLLVYPLEAIHQPGGDEGQHAGLWRGVFDHKNVASAVVSVFVIIGIFCWREGQKLLGLVVVVLAFVFLLNSGSKTSLALLPVAMLHTAFVSRINVPVVRFILILTPLAILFTITVGSAVFDQINGVLQFIAPGTTFTGRLDLWQYTVERIAERPVFGFGFESFWGTPIVTNADQPIELTWDVREIVHGHNSYLDSIIAFGLVGATILVTTVILLPAADFARNNWQGPNRRLANLFLTIWIFASLNACLESFFLRRADPVWFSMLIGIIGLRLLASTHANRTRRVRN